MITSFHSIEDAEINLLYLRMRHGVKLAKFRHTYIVTMHYANRSFIPMSITIIWRTENGDNLKEKNVYRLLFTRKLLIDGELRKSLNLY